MSNCFAQSKVLAFGRTAEEVAAEGTAPEVVPHKVMPGNHPSSTIVAPVLTPSVLGQLVALYEHTVFTEGAVWGIDSFDQWGVELGKAMAVQLAPALTDAAGTGPQRAGLLDGRPRPPLPRPARPTRLSRTVPSGGVRPRPGPSTATGSSGR